MNNISRPRLRPRCLYCTSNGHNLKDCDSQSFVDFYEECRTTRIGYDNFTNNIREESKNSFQRWLIWYALRSPRSQLFIKCFSIKYFNTHNSTNITECVESIVNHFYSELNTDDYIRFNIPAGANVNGVWYDYANLNQNIYNFWHNLPNNIHFPEINQKEYTDIHKIIFNLKNKDTDGVTNVCEECVICYDEKSYDSFVKMNCHHKFCAPCFITYIDNKTNEGTIPCCALCRNTITSIEIYDESIKEKLMHKI